MGSNTSGDTKHMIRSHMVYVDTLQVGVVDACGLVPTGTRSCTAYLDCCTISLAHQRRRSKLTGDANCSEKRQGISRCIGNHETHEVSSKEKTRL